LSRARDDPFAALGLAARPDLTDDDVRAAWRRIAASTHPDRADGGDPAVGDGDVVATLDELVAGAGEQHVLA